MRRQWDVRTMSAEQDRQDAARLLELLKLQNGLYQRLRTLADRQRVLITEEDVQPLLSLLAERQQVVDGLVDVNQQLAPFRADWTGRYQRLDETTRREVAGLLEEANSSLGTILQSDQQDSATLSAKRMDIGSRLTTAEVGSRASAAYATRMAPARMSITDAQA
jgi:hypothetical protein